MQLTSTRLTPVAYTPSGIGPKSAAYMQPLGIGSTTAAYMHSSSKRLLLVVYTAPIVENLPSAINSQAAIDTGHSKKLSNLAKIYTDNAKYSGCNDSFIFKLAIFYDICFRANVLPKAKMKAFPSMLKGPALNNYPSNIGISDTIMNSN